MTNNKNIGGSRSNTPSNKKKNSNSNAAEQSQAFQDALEDVHTRFILNLPPEELASSDRVFFQIEQAWWFYEDFICDDMEVDQSTPDNKSHNQSLPRFKSVKPFAKALFAISPFLSPLLSEFDTLWKEFSIYRRQISTFGTILLNDEGTHVVLCQDYMGKSWTFPAGKVNQHETGMESGVRETYEETGFDITCQLGKTLAMSKSGAELTWDVEVKEENALEYVEDGTNKRRTCFICWGVPMDFPFEPVVRKEVRDVQWWEISNLPKKTFAVLPFMKGLRKWIRKNIKQNSNHGSHSRPTSQVKAREGTPSRKNCSRKRNKNTSSKSRSRHSTPGRILESSDLARSGLGTPGEDDRWTEEQMFQVNEKLIGKKVDYDGNPHVFASDGFAGVDPHAFRVVGGGFMNSGIGEIAKAPQKDKLQPLYRKEKDGNDAVDSDTIDGDGLQPFFTNDGETPWGMVVSEALDEQVDVVKSKTKKEKKKEKKPSESLNSDQSSLGSDLAGASPDQDFIPSGGSNSAGLAVLATLRGKGENVLDISKGDIRDNSNGQTIPAVSDIENIFMTDKEITAKSQSEKLNQKGTNVKDSEVLGKEDDKQKSANEVAINEHFLFCRQWASNLDKGKPTNFFGEFRFDVDAIMVAAKTL